MQEGARGTELGVLVPVDGPKGAAQVRAPAAPAGAQSVCSTHLLQLLHQLLCRQPRRRVRRGCWVRQGGDAVRLSVSHPAAGGCIADNHGHLAVHRALLDGGVDGPEVGAAARHKHCGAGARVCVQSAGQLRWRQRRRQQADCPLRAHRPISFRSPASRFFGGGSTAGASAGGGG